MASEVYINIKDLPELTQLNNGDYILAETATGTHIVNFGNFLIPTQNTVITSTVNENASAFNSYVTNLSSNLDLLFTSTDIISSNLDTLSSSVEFNKNSLSALANTYIKSKIATIQQGDYTTSLVIDVGAEYSNENILITPANQYAALYPAYIDSIDVATNLITIRGTFNNKIITYINTNNDALSVNNGDLNTVLNTIALSTVFIPAEDAADYNVFVIKT